MCLSVPATIVSIDGDRSVVDMGGVRKVISLALVDGATVGGCVLVHAGFAIGTLSTEEATATLALMAATVGNAGTCRTHSAFA